MGVCMYEYIVHMCCEYEVRCMHMCTYAYMHTLLLDYMYSTSSTCTLYCPTDLLTNDQRARSYCTPSTCVAQFHLLGVRDRRSGITKHERMIIHTFCHSLFRVPQRSCLVSCRVWTVGVRKMSARVLNPMYVCSTSLGVRMSVCR